MSSETQNRLKLFLWAITVPLRALFQIARYSKLRRLAVVPFLINAVLFSALLFGLFYYDQWLVSYVWQQPALAAWYDYLLLGLWYVVYGIVISVSIGIVYIGTLALGGVLASPILELLSEKAEQILATGSRQNAIDGFDLQRDILKPIYSTGIVFSLYLAIMGISSLFYFIPTAGPWLAWIVQITSSLYFLTLEYSESTMERSQLTIRQKLSFFFDYPIAMGGFGVGTLIFLSIPILNLTAMPVLTVAGTIVTNSRLKRTDVNP